MEAAELAASEVDRGRDVAELLVDLALFVGPDRAVDSAVAILGRDEVALSLRRLQPLALSPIIRRRLKADKGTLERLRSTVEDRTGASDIELDQNERVSPRTLLMILSLIGRLPRQYRCCSRNRILDDSWIRESANGRIIDGWRVSPGHGGWARRDLNPRPSDYESLALTN